MSEEPKGESKGRKDNAASADYPGVSNVTPQAYPADRSFGSSGGDPQPRQGAGDGGPPPSTNEGRTGPQGDPAEGKR